MILSMIAAIGKNNELGNNNWLLWHLPNDMKHFRETTRGHAVIMGRKTFESLPGGPLPKRRNIVVTRDKDYKAEGIELAYSLETAINMLKHTDEEVFIIGGGQLYAQAMPFADRLYITRVDNAPLADTFFPDIGPEWKEIFREEHAPDAEHLFPYAFLTYEKIA